MSNSAASLTEQYAKDCVRHCAGMCAASNATRSFSALYSNQRLHRLSLHWHGPFTNDVCAVCASTVFPCSPCTPETALQTLRHAVMPQIGLWLR